MSICTSRAKHRVLACYGLLFSCAECFGRPRRPRGTWKTRPSLLFPSRRYRTIMSKIPNNDQLRERARSGWSDLSISFQPLDPLFFFFLSLSQWSKGWQVNFPHPFFLELNPCIIQNQVGSLGKVVNLHPFSPSPMQHLLAPCWDTVLSFPLSSRRSLFFLTPSTAMKVNTQSFLIQRYSIERVTLLIFFPLTSHPSCAIRSLLHICQFPASKETSDTKQT